MARRTKEDAFATRSSLLDAAELVFYEQGVARASLGEIAQRAGTTRGAVYWHFKDKLDLFYAMMDRVTLPLEQVAYGENEAPECCGLARVRHVVALVFDRLVVDERTRRVFEVALHKVEYVGELVAVQDRNLQAMNELAQQLELNLASAAKHYRVSLPMAVDEAAIALRCMFEGLIYGWLLGGGNFDIKAVGERSVDTYLAGLGFGAALQPLVARDVQS